MSITISLLKWYDENRRLLPWRAAPGEASDPYRIWLSEIMLQQTNVSAVKSYFLRFLERWPRLEDLAEANLDEVLFEWQGLGYYSRARNLLACAQQIVKEHQGRFPSDDLQSLPGIGAYTAGAIGAIAFHQPVAAIDANAERVLSRLFRLEDKKACKDKALPLIPKKRPGDFAQAWMDLGSMVCLPGIPKCAECPLKKYCQAFAKGDAALFPRKKQKVERPHRYAVAYWMEDAKGRIAFRRRPDQGLLAGLMEVPNSEWRTRKYTAEEARDLAPAKLDWKKMPGSVEHVFSHFALHTIVLKADTSKAIAGYRWQAPEDLRALALSSLMRKVIKKVMH